jgi:methylmalonyl-CoA/ethylmalonyl-CoA epimerase
LTVSITHIEHIGIAVQDLERSVAFYEKTYGLRCYGIEEVPDQQVRTAFFRVGETKIELLASTSPDGPIARFLERRGEGMHHLAFAVDGLGETLRHVQDAGVELIDARPRPGAEGLQIAFLHPRSTHGVLTELCSEKES